MHQSDDAVWEQINAAQEHVDQGLAAWPGQSYEQGVADALRWAQGDSDYAPMEEEE